MTTQKAPIDSYDEIKKMLNTIRKFQLPSYRNLTEQTDLLPQTDPTVQAAPQQAPIQSSTNKEGITVINNVEVIIDSEDDLDLEISVDEKGKISQLIDDFRKEVSELAELNRLTIYGDSSKLEGQITDINLGFTLSAGTDSGLFLSNAVTLKMGDDVMLTLNKLKKFEFKFTSVINELIMNRKQN